MHPIIVRQTRANQLLNKKRRHNNQTSQTQLFPFPFAFSSLHSSSSIFVTFDTFVRSMTTSLPDLPFPNYGNIELEPGGFHSNVRTSCWTYPRTDLATMIPWTTFPGDVHQAIVSATARAGLAPTPFPISAWGEKRYVENESKIHSHAQYALHEPVEQVVNRLEVRGRFVSPGSGNTAIIGDPDFSWIMGPAQQHPKLIVRVSNTSCHCVHIANAFHLCRSSTRPGGQQI
jgi:hypothetical protein